MPGAATNIVVERAFDRVDIKPQHTVFVDPRGLDLPFRRLRRDVSLDFDNLRLDRRSAFQSRDHLQFASVGAFDLGGPNPKRTVVRSRTPFFGFDQFAVKINVVRLRVLRAVDAVPRQPDRFRGIVAPLRFEPKRFRLRRKRVDRIQAGNIDRFVLFTGGKVDDHNRGRFRNLFAVLQRDDPNGVFHRERVVVFVARARRRTPIIPRSRFSNPDFVRRRAFERFPSNFKAIALVLHRQQPHRRFLFIRRDVNVFGHTDDSAVAPRDDADFEGAAPQIQSEAKLGRLIRRERAGFALFQIADRNVNFVKIGAVDRVPRNVNRFRIRRVALGVNRHRDDVSSVEFVQRLVGGVVLDGYRFGRSRVRAPGIGIGDRDNPNFIRLFQRAVMFVRRFAPRN